MQKIKQTELHLYPHLKPKSHWRTQGYKIKKGVEPKYWAYQKFTHDVYYLYDKSQVEEVKEMSDEDKVAFKRRLKLFCVKCDRLVDHHSELNSDKVCWYCFEKEVEERRAAYYAMKSKETRESIVSLFKELLSDQDVVMLHGESTGLSVASDQLCQLTITNNKGETLFCSLIRPTIEVSPSAYRCHRISSEMLADTPTFKDVSEEVFELLEGKTVVSYNVDFFMAMLKNSAKAHDLESRFNELNLTTECLMHECSRYRCFGYEYYTSLHSMLSELEVPVKDDREYHYDCVAYIELMKRIIGINESRK